jgi:hypothetical protein
VVEGTDSFCIRRGTRALPLRDREQRSHRKSRMSPLGAALWVSNKTSQSTCRDGRVTTLRL